MDIMKIIAVGIVGCVLAVTVKEYKPELAMCVAGVTGIIILLASAEGIGSVFSEVESIMRMTNVDVRYFGSILKVIGVAYLTEYGSELCRDSGYASVAVKLELCGKVCIMLFTIPVIRSFLNVCIEAVKLIW